MPEVWFPNLNIKINHLPRAAFSVAGFSVYWYAVFIALGFIAGLFLARRESKRIGHDLQTYEDFFIVMLVCGILGARAYYVIFSWDSFKDDLIRIFYFREGGLAIYGGIIAVFFAGVIFARVKKINFASFADVCVPCVAMGQAVGRWGNFFNREVFGGYSESLLAMRYMASQVDTVPPSVAEHMLSIEGIPYIQVQPTFLYESLWNLGLFFVLMIFRKRKKFEGQILLMYLAGYGAGRFFIEGIRTDRLMLFGSGIPVSQAVSAVIFVISSAIIIFKYIRALHNKI